MDTMHSENDAPVVNAKGKGRTIEQIYQKKTALEHILLRPDTYSKSSKLFLRPALSITGE